MINYLEEFKKNINSEDYLVSKFLSIEEQVLLKNVKNISFIPENSERKRAIINNDVQGINIDHLIGIIKISFNHKYGVINHRDVLGSIIGLGIKRECIGDIIVDNDIYVLITKEMTQYVADNLFKIGRVSVDIEIVNFDNMNNLNTNNYIEDTYIVSSYRLDSIISERCNFSREKSKQYIILKNVKINGVINTNPDYNVKIDDLISIHKFGRLIIKEEINKTKKDKYVLRVLKTK